MLLYQILASTIQGKIQKVNVETKIYNTFVLRGMLNSNYLMDRILHQIFKIISSISTNLKTELHLKLRKGIILNF